MDTSQILAILSTVPTWVWIVGGIILFTIIFGDKKLWEFEVKFPLQAGVGRGEVEFECLNKKGTFIEAKFELEELYQNKKIEIFLNNRMVYSIPEAKNNSARIYINEKLEVQKPTEGDEVTVNIGGRKQFEGVLVRD